MNTLYINTAQRKTHIAVFDGEKLMREKKWDGYLHEFDTLVPAIEEMLTDSKLTIHDIGQGVVCVGPGGFTSVRLGVSTANALSFSLGIPFAMIDLFSIFEHHQSGDFCIFIEANPEECFVKGVGKWAKVFPEAKLMQVSEIISLIDSPCIGVGQISAETLKRIPNAEFQEHGEEFSLPWKALVFEKRVITPWYYKEAKITERKA